MKKYELSNLLDEYGHVYSNVIEHTTSKNLDELELLRDKILDAVFTTNSDLHSSEKEQRADRIHRSKVKPHKLMKSLDLYRDKYTFGPYVMESNENRYVKYPSSSSIPKFYKRVAARKARRMLNHSSAQKSSYKKCFDYKWTID